jgi:hypothetical protein
MANDWWQSLGFQGVGLVEDIRDKGWKDGFLGHVSKWDPILFGPIAEGILAEDEAKSREKELGPAPTFNIPEGYDFALKQLRKRQNQQMPGYGAAMAGIEQAAAANATGVSQLMSGPDAVMAQSGIYGDKVAQIQDLSARARQWQQEQRDRYAQGLRGRAGLEAEQFEYNQWLPWQIGKNEAAAMRYAGQQAQQSGADTMGAAGMNLATILSND